MTQERNKIFAAVYLILLRDKKVAMIRRYNTGYQDGNFTLPSGHIDAGESAIAATLREAKEETGVDVQPETLNLAHLIHRNSTDRVYADFYFVTESWDGEPVNNEPEKADRLEWFDLNDLPQNIIPDVKTAIELFSKGDNYSEFGW
ncbi:MAG: NUDIX domain-containing protein [Candidatus Dojkabacteria bacterium]|nr:MAG: NUDIX domain-containing protein [Candidatus Dojkabacteria bacterium]